MARIIHNPDGRRMIRLSPEDILMVVSLYQQQMYSLQQKTYDGLQERLKEFQCYLPEEA
ncbi:MAG: hypothetical protein VKJ04_11130 [Vampirovibrionales bacterium]|nr:hypothetical protein [Vampirovibrionales bacterium]